MIPSTISPSPTPKISLGPHTPLPSNEGYCASPSPDATLMSSNAEYCNMKDESPLQPNKKTIAGCTSTFNQEEKTACECNPDNCNLVRPSVKQDMEPVST